MGRKKKNNWFALLLTTVFLLQFVYQTVHVLSDHVFENHVETAPVAGVDLYSLIGEAHHSCEICSKLLGKTLFFWAFLIISFQIRSYGFLVINKTDIPVLRNQHVLPLRGPPLPLLQNFHFW